MTREHRHHRFRTFSATAAPSTDSVLSSSSAAAVEPYKCTARFSASRRRSSAASTSPSCPSFFGIFYLPSRRRLLMGCALLVLLFQLSLSIPSLTRFLCSAVDDNFPPLMKRLFNCNNNKNGGVLLRLMERRHLLRHELIVEPWHDESARNEDGVIVRPPPDSAEVESCSKEVRQWREREAVAALQAAKRSRWEGNMRRARSIIEHAYSLAPYNPDILTEYGIYVEMARSDVVQAEGFYLKALARNPRHEEALIRRRKALPLVEEIDNRMMREIERKRDRFMRIPHNDSGLKRSMRESYFAYVYHTVAMEGNTINLAQTRSILETRMAVAGKSIVEHNEILGLDAALRYLNQSLLEVQEITLEHILALHKRVLGFADPLSAGVIRNVQVFVGNFRPPDPDFVMVELEELVSWLNDEETHRLDAVEVAALAHYKLVFVHPFMDGNGRTSRLLMNWILLRAGFPPVTIPVEQRHRYYNVLREANDGDLRPFIRFIAELTDRTLESLIASSASSLCEIGGNCSGDAADVRPADEALDTDHRGHGERRNNRQQSSQPFCAMEHGHAGH
uniref:protein adenylyltransferase n=1 Tax=Globodera rostochiensis TaxID=31243 RepID=A0A914HC09_GLORO